MIVLRQSALQLQLRSLSHGREIQDSEYPWYRSHGGNADSGNSRYQSRPRLDSLYPRMRHGRCDVYGAWPPLDPAPPMTEFLAWPHAAEHPVRAGAPKTGM